MASETSTSVLPDLGPDVYEKWRASGIGAITEQLQRRLILTLLEDIQGRNVLDVGCGDGDLAVELWRRGATVTGAARLLARYDAALSRIITLGAAFPGTCRRQTEQDRKTADRMISIMQGGGAARVESPRSTSPTRFFHAFHP
jgi:SAM-dependent methyltransferase